MGVAVANGRTPRLLHDHLDSGTTCRGRTKRLRPRVKRAPPPAAGVLHKGLGPREAIHIERSLALLLMVFPPMVVQIVPGGKHFVTRLTYTRARAHALQEPPRSKLRAQGRATAQRLLF